MDYQAKQKEIELIDKSILALEISRTSIQREVLKESLKEAFEKFPQLQKLKISADCDSTELYAVTEEYTVQMDDSYDLIFATSHLEDYNGKELNEDNVKLFREICSILSKGGWDDLFDVLGTIFNMEMEDFGNYYNFNGNIERERFMEGVMEIDVMGFD